MTYTARYLDNGFYTVSDRAAGELCRAVGNKLPDHGWQTCVSLEIGEHKLNAWLQRTLVGLSPKRKRKWSWALFGVRAHGGAPLGSEFRFIAKGGAL